MKGSSANSIFYEVFSFNIWTFIAHVIKLAGDVTYGLQKELFKFLLVTLAGAVFAEIRTALSAPKLPVLPPSNLAEWQQARLTARELLQQALARRRVRHAIAVVLGLWIAGCSVSTLMPLSPPLPPPPPPPPLLLVVRRAGASRAVQAVRYCRAHRVELVLVMSSLLLADWLNVLATPWVEKKAGECRGLQRRRACPVPAKHPKRTSLVVVTQVSIDRLDPLVRIAQGALRQAARLGRVLSRGVRAYRVLTQRQAADAASIGHARAAELHRGFMRPL